MSGRPVVLVVAVPSSEVLTLNGRYHWTRRQAATKALRARAESVVRRAGSPVLGAAECRVEVFYPDHRRRDVDNLHATVKPLVDGMVGAGLLPDDDDAHLTGPHLVHPVGAEAPPSLLRVPDRARPFTFRFTFTSRPVG